MDCRNSSLLLPAERKQLGESQSKYEQKDICIFMDQKCSVRYSVTLFLLLLLEIVASHLKIKGKHAKLKNPEKRSGSHCHNSRKFCSILVDSINIKVHGHSLSHMKESTFQVQQSLNFPATPPQTDLVQPVFLLILESHFGKTKLHFIPCEGSCQTSAWKPFVSFIKNK